MKASKSNKKLAARVEHYNKIMLKSDKDTHGESQKCFHCPGAGFKLTEPLKPNEKLRKVRANAAMKQLEDTKHSGHSTAWLRLRATRGGYKL